MRQKTVRTMLSGFLIALCCFLCHCGGRYSGGALPSGDVPRTPAEKKLQELLAANAGLDAIKGLGRVTIRQEGQFSTFRATWGGMQPGRFRLDARTDVGQPVVSFASDGKYFYLLSYSENQLYRRKVSEKGLKRIISIDMTVEDFLMLLCGRLPIQRADEISLKEDGGFGPELIVEDGECRCIEKIILDTSRTRVREFERRKRSGTLQFRVVFEKYRETDGFQLPESLTITDDDGVEIQLTVERSWVNPSFTQDQFVLNVP